MVSTIVFNLFHNFKKKSKHWLCNINSSNSLVEKNIKKKHPNPCGWTTKSVQLQHSKKRKYFILNGGNNKRVDDFLPYYILTIWFNVLFRCMHIKRSKGIISINSKTIKINKKSKTSKVGKPLKQFKLLQQIKQITTENRR